VVGLLRINRENLLASLDAVKPGLVSQSSVCFDEQLGKFIFMGGKVYAYSDEIGVCVPSDIRGAGFAVESGKFYELLKKINADEVDVSVDNNEVKIVADNIRAGVSCVPVDEAPNFLVGVDELSWINIPDDFSDAIKMVLISCDRKTDVPILSCVHISSDGYVETSDVYRFTRYYLNDCGIGLDESVLISYTAAAALLNYNVTKMAKNDSWVYFELDNSGVFACRRHSGEFPDFTKLIDVTGSNIKFNDDLNVLLDSVMVFSSDGAKCKPINIAVGGGKAMVVAKGESGWATCEVDVEFDGEFAFRINPRFLKEILVLGTVEGVVSDRVIKFSGDGWVHLIALVAGSDD